MKNLMRLGLGLLNLPPERFWTLTLPEFIAICTANFDDPASTAPTYQELQQLMQLYPDGEKP